ncbi:MAG: hypothetical protein U0172_13960 [Nitrospiraceae bacterium]
MRQADGLRQTAGQSIGRSTTVQWVRVLSLATGCSLAALGTAWAAPSSQVPWECSNYSEDAQARCMQALIETQRERIGQLEGELKAQQGAVGELRQEVDRQSMAAADMQRQLATPPPVAPAPVYTYPPAYAYPPSYAYPPVGLGVYPGFGLYLGRPWRYGYGPSVRFGYAPGFRFSYGYRPYGGYRFGYRPFVPCHRWGRGC